MAEAEQRFIAKAKKIQKQLVMFFHAYKCAENDAKHTSAVRCQLKHCATLKRIIEHLKVCREHSCTFNHCRPTRVILNHWNKCDGAECLACGPLKQAHSRMQSDDGTGDMTTAFLGNLTVIWNTDEMGLGADADTTIGNVTLNMDETMVTGGEAKEAGDARNAHDPWDELLAKIKECGQGIKHIEKERAHVFVSAEHLFEAMKAEVPKLVAKTSESILSAFLPSNSDVARNFMRSFPSIMETVTNSALLTVAHSNYAQAASPPLVPTALRAASASHASYGPKGPNEPNGPSAADAADTADTASSDGGTSPKDVRKAISDEATSLATTESTSSTDSIANMTQMPVIDDEHMTTSDANTSQKTVSPATSAGSDIGQPMVADTAKAVKVDASADQANSIAMHIKKEISSERIKSRPATPSIDAAKPVTATAVADDASPASVPAKAAPVAKKLRGPKSARASKDQKAELAAVVKVEGEKQPTTTTAADEANATDKSSASDESNASDTVMATEPAADGPANETTADKPTNDDSAAGLAGKAETADVVEISIETPMIIIDHNEVDEQPAKKRRHSRRSLKKSVWGQTTAKKEAEMVLIDEPAPKRLRTSPAATKATAARKSINDVLMKPKSNAPKLNATTCAASMKCPYCDKEYRTHKKYYEMHIKQHEEAIAIDLQMGE